CLLQKRSGCSAISKRCCALRSTSSPNPPTLFWFCDFVLERGRLAFPPALQSGG
ncbi:hypothetical protein NDU88_005673, partial [Pleurodeles waltl]